MYGKEFEMIRNPMSGLVLQEKRKAPNAVGVGSFLLLALCLCPFTAEAQTTAKIPNFVLKDGGGQVMGQVVGFGTLGDISLAMDDPAFDNDIPMIINYKDDEVQFEGPAGRVYYSQAECGGTAYVQLASESSSALTRWLGRAYEAGPTAGNGVTPNTDIIIYRGQATAPGLTPTIASRFSGNTCLGSTDFGQTMVVADEVIDVTTQFGNHDNWTVE
jgi:hypothetical protein